MKSTKNAIFAVSAALAISSAALAEGPLNPPSSSNGWVAPPSMSEGGLTTQANTIAANARLLVPDGSSLSDNMGDGLTQWFYTKLEDGKGYAVEVADPDGDFNSNGITGVQVFEADGTTALQNGNVACGQEVVAPAFNADSTGGLEGVRCMIRPFVGGGFGYPKDVRIAVSSNVASRTFKIRLRESTIYSRWSTNGYDMHVELQNTTAFTSVAQIIYYADTGGPAVVASDVLTVPAYGAIKVVKPAFSLGPSNRGTLRVIPWTSNFVPGQINVNAYGFWATIGQFLFFNVERSSNQGGQNSW